MTNKYIIGHLVLYFTFKKGNCTVSFIIIIIFKITKQIAYYDFYYFVKINTEI